MFENILAQNQAVHRLTHDIASDTLAPAILFSGPRCSGKGTAALELARVLSCEDAARPGAWNCSCASCTRHRNLVSPDLLIMGRRRFFTEIAASGDVFLRNSENQGSRMLFLRSVRKLLARFNPVLWEDDPKLGKLKGHIAALEEDLETLETIDADGGADELSKQCGSVIKKAAKLETEGLGELVPIAQIRRAAYWSRMAPLGNHKCVIIENAEYMQEGAKNALLKILEEPPPRVTLILTGERPRSLLPTMLSRLREYRFAARNSGEAAQVMSRIFRVPQEHTINRDSIPAASMIESYLDSFLPVQTELFFPLAAFFAASVAAEAVRTGRAKGNAAPPLLVSFGSFAAGIAEEGSMGRPASGAKEAIEKVLGKTEGFELPGLFTRFLRQCGALVSAWLGAHDGAESGADKLAWAELWRRELSRAAAENDTYNIGPITVMERLFEEFQTGMT